MRAMIPTTLLLLLLLPVAGCNLFDDDDDDAPAATPSVYATAISGIGPAGESGRLSITLPAAAQPMAGAMVSAAVVSATGSLAVGSDDAIPLGGMFDSTTGDVMLEGGGYSFTGRRTGASIDSTYTGPGGSGSFSALQDAIPAGFDVMLGDWSVRFDEESCEGTQSASGFLRFTFDGDQLVVISTDGSGECEVDDLNGSLVGNTFREVETSTNPIHETCTETETSELTANFSGNRFDATATEVETYEGTNCPAPCPVTLQVSGERCTDCFPECTVFEEARLRSR